MMREWTDVIMICWTLLGSAWSFRVAPDIAHCGQQRSNPFWGQKLHYEDDQTEDESVDRLPSPHSLSTLMLPFNTRSNSFLLTPRKDERSFLFDEFFPNVKWGTPRNFSRSFLCTWLEVLEVVFWITKMSWWFLFKAESVWTASAPRWWNKFFLLRGNVWQMRDDCEWCFLGGRGGGVMTSSRQ